MSVAQPQVSWDSRPVISRLRRHQLHKVLIARRIPFDPDAPKTQLLKVLEANRIDLNQPVPELDWQVVHGKDENGFPTQELYPVSELHESARLQSEGKVINYDQIIADRAKAQEEVKLKTDVVETQNAMINQLMARLESLEKRAIPYSSMSPPQLKRLAIQQGIDITGLRSKVDLIAALEA